MRRVLGKELFCQFVGVETAATRARCCGCHSSSLRKGEKQRQWQPGKMRMERGLVDMICFGGKAMVLFMKDDRTNDDN